MKLEIFFAHHPVFRHAEFIAFLQAQGTKNPHTQRELLAYHLNKKHVVRIRRGLYATLPLQVKAEVVSIDPYLVAGRITEDAVLAYHTALAFHGVAYSVFHEFTYLSHALIRPFAFQSATFRRLPVPKKLYAKQKNNMEIITGERLGLEVRITSLERTVVDVLDCPQYAGGIEEVWRSLESIAVLDIERVIHYAFLLGNATTIAKLGFFLEEYQELFAVSESQLKRLQKKIPSGYHYFNRTERDSGKFNKRWHLVIPNQILHRTWEEPHVDF